jgi:hypothetical protein
LATVESPRTWEGLVLPTGMVVPTSSLVPYVVAEEATAQLLFNAGE